MAAGNYQACVAFVRRQEGGNSDTPGDHGGRTGRGGITHATYDVYRAGKGLSRRDVFLITDAEIADIYRAGYWNLIHGDGLEAGVDLCIFDYAINSGPDKANEARLLAGAGDVADRIRKICAGRLSFMHALGSSWRRFGAGWGGRVAECEALALKMAGVLSPAVAGAAKRTMAAHKRIGAGAAAGGGAAIAIAHHFAGAGNAVLAIIIGVAIIAILAATFNAWRHGQRADALGYAVQQLAAAQAAAGAARMKASAEADAKEQSIAAEKAALDKAKAAIGGGLATGPSGNASK
ncbi:MAG: glycosyl hydrolase 108 family protein [Methylocella sp.]